MKPLRVLIVEDEAVIAMLLAEVLAGMGHFVSAIATTEAEALEAAGQSRPDLMIVDARLRTGSGVSAVAQILLTGFVPHVFVTGDTLKPQVLSPAAVVLQKPFLESHLVKAILQALDVPHGQ
jgi:CheY-like chemotaxis protein